MEKHLLYKQEAGGSIPSCPDIHREWQQSIFGDEFSFDHRQWAYGDIFQPSPKYEMVTVNEHHHIYSSIVIPMKGLPP